MGAAELNRTKPDLFFPLVLAEICQELFSSLRAHEAKPLPRYSDTIPVQQDRRESPSSRVQRLNVLLNVVRADSWRMPFGGGGNVEREWIDENRLFGGVSMPTFTSCSAANLNAVERRAQDWLPLERVHFREGQLS